MKNIIVIGVIAVIAVYLWDNLKGLIFSAKANGTPA